MSEDREEGREGGAERRIDTDAVRQRDERQRDKLR